MEKLRGQVVYGAPGERWADEAGLQEDYLVPLLVSLGILKGAGVMAGAHGALSRLPGLANAVDNVLRPGQASPAYHTGVEGAVEAVPEMARRAGVGGLLFSMFPGLWQAARWGNGGGKGGGQAPQLGERGAER